MFIRAIPVITIFSLSASLFALGCAGGKQGNRTDDTNEVATPVAPETTTTPEAQAEAVAPPAEVVTLQGTVIMKPWSKSAESWNAGGSEYYVLDVGDQEIQDRSAEEGVILRATGSVSMDALAALVGQQVRVTGNYVQAQPYTPKDPGEQYPTGMNGEPLPRGSGFQVSAIEPAQ